MAETVREQEAPSAPVTEPEYEMAELVVHAEDLFNVPAYVLVAAHKLIGRPARVSKSVMQDAVEQYMARKVS